MNLSPIKRRLTPRNITLLLAAALVVWLVIRRQSQKSDDFVAEAMALDSIPTMVTYDSNIVHTDSGYPRYHATAPVYYSFDNAKEPFWRFDQGAFIEQYDNQRNVVATMECDSAVYLQTPQIWNCMGNVRINNVNGDRFLTNQLFYDVRMQKIYSDSFIHIEKSDKVIEGYGFQSNSAITDYVVNRPTMIIPVSEFNRPPSAASDSTAAPGQASAPGAADHSSAAGVTASGASGTDRKKNNGRPMIPSERLLRLDPDAPKVTPSGHPRAR